MDMTYKSNKIKIIDLDSILKTVSLKLFNNNEIFNNIYKLDKLIPYTKKVFIKKIIQHYLLIEFINLIKKHITGQKTVILIQPTMNTSIEFLADPMGEILYKNIKKFIKKIQCLIPLYFCFIEEFIIIDNITYLENLNKQSDLYYLLMELTNKDKKYNIKKFKAFLLKHGFTVVLKDHFENTNNLVINES